MPVLAQTTPGDQLERAKREGWRYTGDMATEGEVLDLLYSLVVVTKPDVCVETGTYCGHGTKAISEGLKMNERGHLWTVESNPDLTKQYAEMELERTTFVDADSIEWSEREAPARINFALVDCCESPSDRVRVFENLFGRITPGGMICAHDVAFYTPSDYLHPLCDVAGRAPNLVFEALNGIAIWVIE